jgi:hypothetical protein
MTLFISQPLYYNCWLTVNRVLNSIFTLLYMQKKETKLVIPVRTHTQNLNGLQFLKQRWYYIFICYCSIFGRPRIIEISAFDENVFTFILPHIIKSKLDKSGLEKGIIDYYFVLDEIYTIL